MHLDEKPGPTDLLIGALHLRINLMGLSEMKSGFNLQRTDQ